MKRLKKNAGDLIQFPNSNNTAEVEKAFNMTTEGFSNIVTGLTYLDFQLNKIGLIEDSEKTKGIIGQLALIEQTLADIQCNIQDLKNKTP